MLFCSSAVGMASTARSGHAPTAIGRNLLGSRAFIIPGHGRCYMGWPLHVLPTAQSLVTAEKSYTAYIAGSGNDVLMAGGRNI